MIKKISCLLLILFVISCFHSSLVSAQQGLNQLKSELNELRWKMKDATNEYKDEVAGVKQKSAEKLVALKKEFHKTRAQYINERKNQETELLGAYNAKMKPMTREEKHLLNQIEPRDSNNFARNR